jgi:hypothetical protein
MGNFSFSYHSPPHLLAMLIEYWVSIIFFEKVLFLVFFWGGECGNLFFIFASYDTNFFFFSLFFCGFFPHIFSWNGWRMGSFRYAVCGMRCGFFSFFVLILFLLFCFFDIPLLHLFYALRCPRNPFFFFWTPGWV